MVIRFVLPLFCLGLARFGMQNGGTPVFTMVLSESKFEDVMPGNYCGIISNKVVYFPRSRS